MKLSEKQKNAIGSWLVANGHTEAEEIHLEVFPSKIVVTRYVHDVLRMELSRTADNEGLKTGYYLFLASRCKL